MGTCSRCENPRRKGGRYCVSCHAAWMRENRPKHRELSDDARKYANCRSYTHVYIRRRKIDRAQECEKCGTSEPQVHHPDYDRPLEVVWLCRPCHLDLHAEERPD